MTDEKKEPAKVSEFAGRRDKKVDPSKLAIATNQPEPGGDQGTFDRPPCGQCIHWKKNPAQGLDFGNCMMMPPVIMTVAMPNGQPGAINVRPGMRAASEGCDQFEDEDGNTVFDDDDDPEPDGGTRLAAVG